MVAVVWPRACSLVLGVMTQHYNLVAGAFSFVPFPNVVFHFQLEFCIWDLYEPNYDALTQCFPGFHGVTRCEHDKVVSAVNCVMSLIGDKNPEHFFVATQDPGLREKLREVSTTLICRV